MLTPEILQKATNCDAITAVVVTPHINSAIEKYKIEGVAMFIAQTCHESAKFETFVENLNYSSTGLLRTFPSRYTESLALKHHRKPEMIANHVYGGRMGNTLSTSGWRYKGRGAIQLTGYSNYLSYALSSGFDVINTPELLEQPYYAFDSAGWFWRENKLDKVKDDIQTATRKINGGLNGLDDRNNIYRKVKNLL